MVRLVRARLEEGSMWRRRKKVEGGGKDEGGGGQGSKGKEM